MISEVPSVARNWWLFVALGVVCVATGIAVLVWPGPSLLTFGILAGIYLMIAAAMELIDAVTGDPGGRAISAILGVLALIAGLICIRRPGETLLALVIAVGIYLTAAGVIRIVRALGSEGLRWWGVAFGTLEAVVGIAVLAWPKIGLVTLAVFFAVTMLFRGIVSIFVGVQLRALAHAEEHPPTQPTTTFA
jgi:uncharacterized membrane protein HdeD (DUF308 family)